MLKDNMNALALDLISRFGSTATITSYIEGYDTSSGKKTRSVNTSLTVKATIEAYSGAEIEGSIKFGDIKMMVANDNFTIDSSSDEIVFMGVEYNIVNVEPMYLQDKVIVYSLQLRA